MRKLRIISSLMVTLALIGLPAQSAMAIESSGIGALPAHPRSDNPRTKSIFVYDEATPEDPISDGVRVINNTETTKTLAVYPVDSQASSDGAFACAQKVEPRKEVGSWIKLAESQVTVPANGAQVVPFVLTVPNGVKGGEHNGCLVVQEVAPPSEASHGIVLSFRSALRVAITTPGALQNNLSFVDVKTRDINQTTLGISPILKNTGNVSTDANVEVKLTGLAFKYNYVGTGGLFPVFPGVESRFNFELKKPFWGGWFNRDVQARYRKQLPSGQLSDDVTNIRAKNAIIFIMPQPLALVIELIIALVILLLLLYPLFRAWRFHRLRKRSVHNYTVHSDESLERIASHYHIKWKKLAKLNHIKPPYTLHPGQILKTPPLPHKPKKPTAKNK